MHMWFWWDCICNNFLFYGYNISSVIVFVVSCFAMLGAALFFEYLKMLHAKVKQKRIMKTQKLLRSICPSESDTLLTASTAPSTSTAPQASEHFVITKKDKFVFLISDLSLWLSQNILGYILMLIVMLYNGYMVISIVAGSTIGYFLFGPTLMKINIETCRAIKNTFCMADCSEPDKTTLLAPGSHSEASGGDTSPPICHTSTNISETNAVLVHT